VVGLVLDLAVPADRLPEPAAQQTIISGLALPRIAVPAGTDPLPVVLAARGSSASGD
jgi:hypothetical protein